MKTFSSRHAFGIRNLLSAALLFQLSVPLPAADPPFVARLDTRHSFRTSDKDLQRLHDEAESKLLRNIVPFTPAMKVLVEGGGYGMFTKEMADAFVDNHLLNPDSFWTPVPLPSIAIHEPLFHNGRGNNWSGQPQGLTYQRAIDALENYGRFAEVTRLGQTLLPVLIRNDCKFAQQLNPHTGAPSGPRPDGYGPMMLTALEYISRMHGIHLAVADSRVWWSAVDATDFTAAQRWGEQEWRMESKDGSVNALVAGKPVFTVTAGARVVTDLAGRPQQIVGISPEVRKVTLAFGSSSREFTIHPNEIIAINPVKL